MQDSQVKMIMAALLIMQFLPFFLVHIIVSGFQYEDEEERRWVLLRSILINIAGNVMIWFIVFFAVFKGNSSLIQLIQMNGTYQDAARLAACGVICMAISACAACGGVLLYFRGDWEDFRLSRSAVSKVLLLASLAVIPVLLGISVSRSGVHHLIISGYCRKTVRYQENAKTGETEEDKGSFVLIRNNGTFACEVKDLFLSEDDRNLTNLRLEDVVLAPGESFRQDFSSDESLNVKKNGGSMVFLSDAEGVLLDSIVVPALKEEETYLLSDGDWKIVKKTVEDDSTVTVAPPVFSAPGGFYEKEFELTLSSEPGTTIYYTLDGSDPTAEANRYEAPIRVYDRSNEQNEFKAVRNVQRDYLRTAEPSNKPVLKAFVVRAICADESGNTSTAVTHTFFVNNEIYRNSVVISLVSDPRNLFDPEIGIYVTGAAHDKWYAGILPTLGEGEALPTKNMPKENYLQKGISWERPAHMELYAGGKEVLSQNVGIRIQGDSNRIWNTLKRFSIYARKEYSGSNFFNELLLVDYNLHSIQTRSGDLHVLCQSLCADRDVETVNSQSVRLYLDGEFWAKTYLIEKFGEKNLSQKYNLNPDNIVIIRNGEADKRASMGQNSIDALLDYVDSADFSTAEAYDRIKTMIDVQSYIEMACINAYFANMDVKEFANNLVWHTIIAENNGVGDSRWRWGLSDMDLLWQNVEKEFADIPAYQINPFTMRNKYNASLITEWRFFSALRHNSEFTQKFVLTFMDLVNHNFAKENTAKVQQMLGIGDEKISNFLANRNDYVPVYLANEFSLNPNLQNVKLYTFEGNKRIMLNSIAPELIETEQEVPETMPWEAWKAEFAEPLPPYYQWEGKYFTEYPVTVSTEEPDFLRWEVTSGGQTKTFNDRSIEVPVVEGGVEIHAVFK